MKKLMTPDVAIAVFLFLLALPFMDEIALVGGYPLRLMATGISVAVLRLFGSDVLSEGTTMCLGERSIAVTDACSGIEELVGLLLVGYLLARSRQKNLVWTAFAWLYAIPSVVLANALRLVVLAVLYGCVGESVLSGAWHVGLGWFQVALALALMASAGELVRRAVAK